MLKSGECLLNILMVVPHFPLPKGGIELHVRGLSKNLVQRGHDVVMIAPSPTNVHLNLEGAELYGIKSFNLPGWPYYSLKSFNVPYNIRSFVSQVKKLMNKREIDVVHAQGQKYLYTSIAVKLSNLAKVPTILTIHGTYGLRYYGSFARFIEETFNRTVFAQTLQSVSAIICCTQSGESYANQYYEDIKGFNIPNGIDVARFRDALRDKQKFREEFGIPSDKKIILSAGRLTPVKGVIELMEATASITKEFPDAFFVIVGDGPLRKQVERFVNPRTVRFFKWIPHSEMFKIYALSDIFVLPSRSEGQPLTLLEAMASQLHILSTPVGGIPETLDGYPFKRFMSEPTPVGIAAGLGEALKKLSEHEDFDKEALAYVERFDWTNVTAETEKVYSYVSSRSF